MNSLTVLATFGAEFEARVKKAVLVSELPNLHVSPTGLAFVLNPEAHTARALGCPLCLDKTTTQNAAGDPCFGVQVCVKPEPERYLAHIGVEGYANLWLCPRCSLPVMSLMPKWDVGRKLKQP